MVARDDEIRVERRTEQSRAMVADTARAMAITTALNRLGFDDLDEIRRLFADLVGRPLDDQFRLIPPFYGSCGRNLVIGRNVFINQNCTIYDLAPVTIGDDVLIGPNVSLITAGHPVAPSQRTEYVSARPITIGPRVWIAAGVIVIGGVTIGANSVVAAGSVVTRDVPPDTLVGGNPARSIRSIAGE